MVRPTPPCATARWKPVSSLLTSPSGGDSLERSRLENAVPERQRSQLRRRKDIDVGSYGLSTFSVLSISCPSGVVLVDS